MNSLTLARALNERRHRPSPTITTGELLVSVGEAGMQEALQRNWLVPDLDSGFLMLNTNAGKLAEITECATCRKCTSLTCACTVDEAAPVGTAMAPSMRESWAGVGVGTGRGTVSTPTDSSSGPSMPRTPQTTPTAPKTDENPQIGDDVMVTEDGKTFTGKVSTLGQDGRYRLSFGSSKPRMDREYNSNEIRKLASAVP